MLRLKTLLSFCAVLALCWAQTGEVLYNGIRLPAAWPPELALGPEPQPTPPYLIHPPDVVPIDVGRQLFVDYFLIEDTNLKRTFHSAKYFQKNPVLKADTEWEYRTSAAGWAMPYSDGVFFDPSDQLFKMWYRSEAGTLYAQSRDGVKWEKPMLDVRPGTNYVLPTQARDSTTVWLDVDEKDPARRFKFFLSTGHKKPAQMRFSADGIHWSEPAATSPPISDRSTFFYNPFRKVYVLSLREHDWTPGMVPDQPHHLGRIRSYWENADPVEVMKFREGQPKLWTSADRLDARRVDLNVRPQLYNLDAVAYESVMVGLFTIWHGQPGDREKPNDVSVAFSRDGYHWDRTNRSTFLPISEKHGDWNYSNVQSAGGVLLVVGDRLFFYVSGRGGVPNVRAAGPASTALATLRRDGFVSMDGGRNPGTLTTRPVVFKGKYLFVNTDSVQGELRVEVLDRNGRPLPGYSKEECVPVRADNTMQRVTWKDSADLSKLAGTPVRFRFHLRSGSLYSFWVSPEETGASHGYVGAGGPGFTTSRDTVGGEAYRICCRPPRW